MLFIVLEKLFGYFLYFFQAWTIKHESVLRFDSNVNPIRSKVKQHG